MRYVIIPTAEVTQEMIDYSTSATADVARKCPVTDCTILEIPEMTALFFNYQSYSQAEIIELTKTDPHWTGEEVIDEGVSLFGKMMSFFK